MEMAVSISSAVLRYKDQDNGVAVFMHALRGEIDEEFRFVQVQLKKTVLELLKAQIRTKNPYLSEKNLLAKATKKTSSFLSEEEWVDVVSYLYGHDDAVSVTMKIKMEIQKSIPNPKPLSPASKLRLSQLQASGKHVSEDVRLSLNPSEANKILFKDFLKVLLYFQLDGHVKFLSNFVSMFRQCDSNADGAVDEAEFSKLLKLLDQNRTEIDVMNAINQFDPNGIGRYTFSQCVLALSNDLLKK
ncbi:hypothetical protein GEMRC1_008928 [Eukaryota sp. GEM-RC1]